jgi:hypothetical protein
VRPCIVAAIHVVDTALVVVYKRGAEVHVHDNECELFLAVCSRIEAISKATPRPWMSTVWNVRLTLLQRGPEALLL